jgi:hypothetical protein
VHTLNLFLNALMREGWANHLFFDIIDVVVDLWQRKGMCSLEVFSDILLWINAFPHRFIKLFSSMFLWLFKSGMLSHTLREKAMNVKLGLLILMLSFWMFSVSKCLCWTLASSITILKRFGTFIVVITLISYFFFWIISTLKRLIHS